MGRRKRLELLLVPVTVLALIITGFAWFERRRTPDWRQELDQYLQSAGNGMAMKISAVTPAWRPWSFNGDLGTPVRDDWTWSIERLPYPPQSVYCVLLEPRKEERNNRHHLTAQLVFMAYHSDALWRAGWLVYESAAPYGTPAAENLLERVDCDFQAASLDVR
ncbi:MAG: hypothetical protein ACOC9C_01025 [Chloroflexota bacterium]